MAAISLAGIGPKASSVSRIEARTGEQMASKCSAVRMTQVFFGDSAITKLLRSNNTIRFEWLTTVQFRCYYLNGCRPMG
jgi:hypothetical protein